MKDVLAKGKFYDNKDKVKSASEISSRKFLKIFLYLCNSLTTRMRKLTKNIGKILN